MATVPFPAAAAGRNINRNCSVFVGNIPYDATEEELKAIFSKVGPVISFRLMYDKETRQPKGYGFCEYRDIETAYSCMRNLNDADYQGRPLRVDWADHELRNSEAVQKVLKTSGAEVSERTEKIVTEKLQEFRGKITDELPDISAAECQSQREILAVVEAMSKEQLSLLVSDMQRLVFSQPDTARAFLQMQPQVAIAISLAMLRLGVVTEPYRALEAGDLQAARQKARIVVPDHHQRQAAVGSAIKMTPVGASSHEGAALHVAHPGHHHVAHQGHHHVAHQGHPPSHIPPHHHVTTTLHPQPQAPVSSGLSSAERRMLLEQLQQLTPEEVEALPEDIKQQMLLLMQEEGLM